MIDIQEWLDDSRAQADRAADHVANVAAGVERWTMRVPPTDTDTDTMLIDLLDDTLGQALAALQAVLDLHKRIPSRLWWRTSPGSEEPPPVRPSDICEYCRGNYPCPTVLTITDAIGVHDD